MAKYGRDCQYEIVLPAVMVRLSHSRAVGNPGSPPPPWIPDFAGMIEDSDNQKDDKFTCRNTKNT